MKHGCETIRDFRQWLEEAFDLPDKVAKYGPPHEHPDGEEALPADGWSVCQDPDALYVEIQAAEIAEDARRLACTFGGGHLLGDEVATVTPREALAIVGKLVNWAREAVPDAATLTVSEAAKLLRVSRDKGLAWVNSGRLRAVNTAGGQGRPSYRIARADLEKFLNGRTRRPTPSRSNGGHFVTALPATSPRRDRAA
jgi:excisionase family DNA binding protein